MREDDSNWFSKWEEELPSPEELMPLSQTLITSDLALAFDIRNRNHHHQLPPTPPLPSSAAVQHPSMSTFMPNSSEFAADSGDLVSRGNGEEPAKWPRLVWTPQLHKRFVDPVTHLGIRNAVPKTIMQLMSVDGLIRENVASQINIAFI